MKRKPASFWEMHRRGPVEPKRIEAEMLALWRKIEGLHAQCRAAAVYMPTETGKPRKRRRKP